MQPPQQAKRYRELVAAARAAVAQAFLTSIGNTSYGAAVLTASGSIFRAGQYSSFNHVTNVHAEQGALVLATMAGEPDVVALAVATSASGIEYARPCGVCRQVMAEHAQRTGRDFDVLMVGRSDDDYELKKVSELLPDTWWPATARGTLATTQVMLRQPPTSAPTWPLETGALILLRDGSVAVVWDPLFDEQWALVRVVARPNENTHQAMPDPYRQPLAYQASLADFGRLLEVGYGVRDAFVSVRDLVSVIPPEPLDSSSSGVCQPLRDVLQDAGVNEQQVRVTLLPTPTDASQLPQQLLIVHGDERTARRVEAALHRRRDAAFAEAVQRGAVHRGLDRAFPGGVGQAYNLGRCLHLYAWNSTIFELVFMPGEVGRACFEHGWRALGFTSVHGTVVSMPAVSSVRARFELQTSGGSIEVIAYQPLARLVRPGDQVSLCGTVLIKGSRQRLLQQYLLPDRTIWWELAKEAPA